MVPTLPYIWPLVFYSFQLYKHLFVNSNHRIPNVRTRFKVQIIHRLHFFVSSNHRIPNIRTNNSKCNPYTGIKIIDAPNTLTSKMVFYRNADSGRSGQSASSLSSEMYGTTISTPLVSSAAFFAVILSFSHWGHTCTFLGSCQHLSV